MSSRLNNNVIMSTNTKSNNTTNSTNSSTPLLAQSSFAYGPSSPTISLLSSASSSPSSSSSSPTQLTNSSSMNKKSALSNISAAIAKHQQQITKQNPSGQLNPNTKLLSMLMENNGVACSIVKSNTNIYYNLKVDASTSKAIHYCDKCTNPDCKAIHKSLTKPLARQTSPQPGMTRIFVSPNLQSQVASPLTSSHPSSPSNSLNNLSNINNNNSKLSGANINFIFERRYPLDSNANASSGSGSVSPNSHHNHSHHNHHNHHGPRHIYIRPQTDESGFPLPLSPQALHHAVAAAAALAHNSQDSQQQKPSHFSINFNRTNNSLNKRIDDFMDANKSQNTSLTSDPFTLFPTLNLNSLRYKNILFLDQVIKISI